MWGAIKGDTLRHLRPQTPTSCYSLLHAPGQGFIRALWGGGAKPLSKSKSGFDADGGDAKGPEPSGIAEPGNLRGSLQENRDQSLAQKLENES